VGALFLCKNWASC